MPMISLLWNNQWPLHFLKMHPPLKGCILQLVRMSSQYCDTTIWFFQVRCLGFFVSYLSAVKAMKAFAKLASGNNLPNLISRTGAQFLLIRTIHFPTSLNGYDGHISFYASFTSLNGHDLLLYLWRQFTIFFI